MTRLIWRLARSAAGRFLVGWIFSFMSFVLPLDRLYETATLVAFYHPRPSYPLHILLVPKRRLSRLTELGPADTDLTRDLFATVGQLVADFELERHGYRLIVNGGPYQDVPHLHFHLISEWADAQEGRDK